MADRENSNVRPDAHQNNRTPQQLQHPYNDFDLENLSFEGTDLWTLNDGFFDATDDILQPLSPFDLHLSTENPESVEEGGLVAEGQHNLHVDNPYTVGLNHIPDLDDGFQDLAPPSETPQSVGSEVSPSLFTHLVTGSIDNSRSLR